MRGVRAVGARGVGAVGIEISGVDELESGNRPKQICEYYVMP